MNAQATIAILLFCVGAAISQSPHLRTSGFSNDNLLSKAQVVGNTTWECHYEACPLGWSKQGWNKCFKLRPFTAARNVAEVDCLALNSVLALVTTDSERHFLNSLAMRDIPTNKGLWLGAVRKGNYWFTSDLIDFTYSAWVPGHPDFTVGECTSLLSDATALNETHWGRMQMDPCDRQLYYACQKSQYETDTFVCGPRA